MNRGALLWIAATTLFPAACGDFVQIGAQDDVGPPPPPIDACSGLKCGEACPLTTCSSTECPPSPGGICNLDGLCVFDAPVVCAGPVPSCAGIACGMPCGSCDPNNLDCSISIDAGPGSPTMVCDAFQQCQAGPITCL